MRLAFQTTSKHTDNSSGVSSHVQVSTACVLLNTSALKALESPVAFDRSTASSSSIHAMQTAAHAHNAEPSFKSEGAIVCVLLLPGLSACHPPEDHELRT